MDNVIQQFIDFLIDKNLLYAYRNNIDKRPDNYTIHCESFIIGAFEWHIAPEGFRTWAKLHQEWGLQYDNKDSKVSLTFKELKQIIDDKELELWTD